MPLATALIIAAAAYSASKTANDSKNANEKATDADNAASDGDAAATSSNAPNITTTFLEGKTPIELLPLEQTLTILERPICTVSFYQCSSTNSNNVNDIIQKIELRVQAILKANPWLGGWLVRGKGVGSFFDDAFRLWYDPTGDEMAPHIYRHLSFKHVPLGKDTPFIEYEDILTKSALSSAPAVVKSNPEVVNRKEEPLFRITVVLEPESDAIEIHHTESCGGCAQSTPSIPTFKGFALIASMSHICGDGHTFYRIYNMLLGAAPVVSLIPKRELLYSQKVMELLGRQEAFYVSHITSDPAWAKLFRRESTNVGDDEGSELKGRVFTVNRHWVGNIKASHLAKGSLSDVCTSTLRSPMSEAFIYELQSKSNPTQSTNDIIVSWFWNLLQPDVGMMVVNLRGRIDVATEDHAGNYGNPIPYTKEDYKSAQLIRESLHNCRRAGAYADVEGTNVSTTLPRAHPDLTFSIVTNWSSFRSTSTVVEESIGEEKGNDDSMHWNNSEDINLIRHVPIICPKLMMKTMPKRMSFLVIFSCGPDDVGCVLLAPGRVMDEIDSCGIVKDIISFF